MAGKVALMEYSIPVSPTSLSGLTALARFEFEPGKQNDGTKILMVEWQDDDIVRKEGSWTVTWPGQTVVLRAENSKTADNTKRLYFLLPPNSTVPPHVTLSWQSSTDKSASGFRAQSLKIHTLPAIFTPELGVTSKTEGKRGVLHTIWAKSRLKVLEEEIKREKELNLEGIALEMALSEREWIVSTFGGLTLKAPTLDLSASLKSTPNGQLSSSLQSPRTPGGRRLSEKLKGLSLGTSAKDLVREVNTPTREFHPLSPEDSDVAYSSFNSFRNRPISPKLKTTGKMKAQNPPKDIIKQQEEVTSTPLGYISRQNAEDIEDESLFAIALSPRTPDIAKSPFSFSSEEVAPYLLKGDKRT